MHWTRWTSQIYSEHSIQKQQNTRFSQVHMEHSREQITYWVTNQVSTDTKRLDYNHSLHIFRPQCFETGTQSQEEIWKKLKHMGAKEHPAER